MKDDRIDIRIDRDVKKAFQNKVGKRNVSSVLETFIKKVNKSKKRSDNDDNSTHLFIWLNLQLEKEVVKNGLTLNVS